MPPAVTYSIRDTTLQYRRANRLRLIQLQITYTDKEDLPKLYSMTASALNLTPNQHSEEAIKAILGGAIAVVNGIGTLRNKLSDSHGRGGKLVKPAARHANLAVNMAGTLATFFGRDAHRPKDRNPIQNMM